MNTTPEIRAENPSANDEATRRVPPPATGSVTLTVDQIKDLAEMAGLTVENEITDDDRETEITIEPCPRDGVLDRVEDGGDGVARHYRHIAYFTDLWDEGVFPLGSPNKTAQPRL